MAIAIGTDSVSGQPTATFSIPATDAAAVSVVGSFNDWTPGAHPLEPAGDGTLAVTVVVPPGQDLHFRYLDSDGVWFDDPASDAISEHGSFVSAGRLTTADPALSDTGAGEGDRQPAEPSLTSETVASADQGVVPEEPKRRRGTKQRA